MRKVEKLLYNWNSQKKANKNHIELHDETFRDGLQASYVRNPSIDQKIVLLRLMSELKIHSANIGFPGSSPKHKEDVINLAKYKNNNKLKIKLTCAARSYIDDIIPVVEASQAAGIAIEVGIFLGSSKIRKLVEKWSLKEMGKMVKDSVSFAIKNNLPVMFVTEDTTRAHPETLSYLYSHAIERGAERLCVADTVGFATPEGTKKIIDYVKEKILNGNNNIKIDWHGHRDRGLEIGNCLAAIYSGVDRVHATALGVGERSGNVPMELLLANLKLEAVVKNNLEKLPEYARYASRVLDVPIPVNYPIVGDEAYTTSSGIHAAAQLKAEELGRNDLVATIYSGVDPRFIGRMPEVEIGPMSGKANAILKLRSLGLRPTKKLITLIFNAAKASNNILSGEEIKAIVNGANKS